MQRLPMWFLASILLVGGNAAHAAPGVMGALRKTNTELRHAEQMLDSLNFGSHAARVKALRDFTRTRLDEEERVKDIPLFQNSKGAAIAIIAEHEGLVVLDAKGERLHPSPITLAEYGLVMSDRDLRKALDGATRRMDTKIRLAEATSLPGYATLAEFAMRSPRKLVHLHLNGKPLPLALRDHRLQLIEGPDQRGSIFFAQAGRENYDSVAHLSKADLKAAIHETARMIVEGDRVTAEGMSND